MERSALAALLAISHWPSLEHGFHRALGAEDRHTQVVLPCRPAGSGIDLNGGLLRGRATVVFEGTADRAADGTLELQDLV